MSAQRADDTTISQRGDGIAFEEMLWGHSDDVVAIEQQCFGADAWSPQAFWDELAAVPHAKYYIVALHDDVVIGYAGIGFIAPECEILTVAVRPDWRGHGVGRRLVRTLEATAAAHGCTTVHLEVEDSNTAARAMYASEGYQEVGLRRGYYGAGRNAILMSKTLNADVANGASTPQGGGLDGD